jgi:hypothetical protein
MTTIEATQLSQKTQKTSSYACHICGLNGHKMKICLKFIKMQRCFMGYMRQLQKFNLLLKYKQSLQM